MVDPSAHIFNAIPLIETPEKPSDYLLINSVGNGEWFFHGEDYSFEPKNKRYVPVGWERRDYYPIFDLSVE